MFRSGFIFRTPPRSTFQPAPSHSLCMLLKPAQLTQNSPIFTDELPRACVCSSSAGHSVFTRHVPLLRLFLPEPVMLRSLSHWWVAHQRCRHCAGCVLWQITVPAERSCTRSEVYHGNGQQTNGYYLLYWKAVLTRNEPFAPNCPADCMLG